MRKKFISLMVIICIVFSSTIALAAGATKVQAIISEMKMYFNGKQLAGNIMTSNGVTYMPINVLSNYLGFALSANAKTNRLTITGNANNGQLQGDIASLKAKNNELTVKCSDLISQNTNLQSKINDLNVSVGTLTDQNTSLQSKVNSLNTTTGTLTDQNTNLQSKINDLNLNIGTLTDQNNKLIASNGDLKNQLDNIDSSYKAQISDLNAKLRFYSGGKENNTGQADSDYFNSLVRANSINNSVYPLKKNQYIKTARNNTTETYYKVDVKEGEGLRVAVKAQIDKDCMYLYLFDKDGTRLSDTYMYNGQYGYVGINASKDTTVYICVKGPEGIYYIGFYDAYWNNSASMNDERDNFGCIGTAKYMPIAANSNAGVNIKRDDASLENWYRIDVKEGQTLTVTVGAHVDKDCLYLYLYDKDVSRLDDTYIYDGRFGKVTKKASKDCTYYIMVKGSSGTYNLSYTIN